MSGIVRGSLAKERKSWRKNHPHVGFRCIAGDIDRWHCEYDDMSLNHSRESRTDWEGGFFPLALHFSEDYPSKPWNCQFPPGFFHPNVYPSGTVCLSILDEDNGWRPAISVKQILVGIPDILDQPNPVDQMHIQDVVEYKKKVRQ